MPLDNTCANFFHCSYYLFHIALKLLVAVYGLFVLHRALLSGLYKLALLLAVSHFLTAELCYKAAGYPHVYIAATGVVN